MNSNVLKGENLIFKDQGVQEMTRATLLPYWNAFSFLSTYANADGWLPSEADLKGELDVGELDNLLDQWIVSRLHTAIKKVHAEMEVYKLYQVVPVLVQFIDELTNWYIRLSRRRFWAAKTAKKDDGAYKTLFHVPVSYTHLRAHETLRYLVCRLLLEKKNI